MGVAAPRSTHARVVVNGEFVGLFVTTENIDGRFTRANFNDGTGNFIRGLALHRAGNPDWWKPSTSACGPTRRRGGQCVPDPIVRRGAVGLGQSCVGRAPVHGRRATDEPTCRRPHHPSRRRPLPLVLRRRHRCPLRQPQLLFLRGPDSGSITRSRISTTPSRPRRWQPGYPIRTGLATSRPAVSSPTAGSG